MNKPLFAFLTAELKHTNTTAGNRAQILPAGLFAAIDGRPSSMDGVEVAHWRLTQADAAALIYQSRARLNPYVIDYEHQTILAEVNGQPAPAAGWFSMLEYIPEGADNSGLWAINIEWTDRAKQMISKGEYRYISAVFAFDVVTGAVVSLAHIGLTNNPALHGMEPLMAALTAKTCLTANPAVAQKSNPKIDDTALNAPKNNQEKTMKQVLTALKLDSSSTEAEALVALTQLNQSLADKDQELAALKANQFDPVKHIPMDEHKKTADALAALTLQVDKAEHDQVMDKALKDASILPPSEAYWRAQPLSALKAYLKDASPLAALTQTQTAGNPPGGLQTNTYTPTQSELAMCKSMGLSAEQFANQRQAELSQQSNLAGGNA